MKKKRVKRKLNSKSERNFLRENYVKAWEYIKDSKNFIVLAIILFFIFAILGFLFHPPEITDLIMKYLKEILEKTQSMSSLDMIFFILFNNLKVSFAGILYGFILGIFPLFSISANGYVVGYVSSLAISTSGVLSLLNLFPHGIFELPAIFISFGMGIKLGTFIFYKNKRDTFGNFLLNSFRVFIFVIIPLLITAAIIEGVFISFLS